MPQAVRFPDLHDANWLRARYVDEGLKHREIAGLIGCSGVAVGKALQRYGVKRPPGWTPPDEAHAPRAARYGEPVPVRAFAPLSSIDDLADVDADVAPDELARRLSEGLEDLAALAELAGRTSRDRLWDLVVSEVDPATARAVTFTAAVLAARQAV